MTDEQHGTQGSEGRTRLSRRTVVGGAAWTVPVVVVASSAPAFAASGDSLDKTSPLGSLTPTNRSTSDALSVTLTNGGNPVAGAVVTYSVVGSPAWLSFTQTAVPTDGAGVAATTLQYGSPKPEAGTEATVVASYQALSVTWTLTYLPNLVLVRINDGAGPLVATAMPVFLEERQQNDGAAVPAGTLALPTSVNGADKRLTLSGTATSEGALALSSDSQYLTMTGYDAATGATVASSTSAAVNRTVARVSAAGVVDTKTALTDAASGFSVRSAVTVDGSGFWTTGGGGGVRRSTYGGTTSTQLTTAPANTRVAGLFGGQLYATTGSSPAGLYAIGTGLPTMPTTATFVVASPSPYGFVMFDRSDTEFGADSVYIADDSSIASGGGILKFSLSGGVWSARGTFAPLGSSVRGITGYVTAGGDVVLFVTTPDKLIQVRDTAAYDGTINATASLIATAPTNTVWRGVAFAPSA